MKFLAIVTLKDTASTLPPSVSRQLLETSLDLMNQRKKAGEILEMYVLAGWGRTMVIAEHKSAESVVQAIASVPISAFMDIETYPLADYNESMKAFIESAKAAEKMFPGPPK